MNHRTSIFESPHAERRSVSILGLMAILAVLALFATAVACRLLDPDHDWPQAEMTPSPEALPLPEH